MTTAIKEKTFPPKMKEFIVEAIQDILSDPDFGSQLTAHAKKRLRAAKKEIGVRALSEIKKKYLFTSRGLEGFLY